MSEQTECEQAEQMSLLMSLTLDGLLDSERQQRLQSHLELCRLCQAEWVAMQQVSALFDSEPMAGPSYGFAIRVGRELETRHRRRRRAFGGVAVATGSLSLVGLTMTGLAILLVGLLIWQWPGALPSVEQGTSAASQLAFGMGLVGKGASLFLKDLLVHYAIPLVLLLGVGLAAGAGLWLWLLAKRPNGSHHNRVL
jgi:anti-sigma factor RsiW